MAFDITFTPEGQGLITEVLSHQKQVTIDQVEIQRMDGSVTKVDTAISVNDMLEGKPGELIDQSVEPYQLAGIKLFSGRVFFGVWTLTGTDPIYKVAGVDLSMTFTMNHG